MDRIIDLINKLTEKNNHLYKIINKTTKGLIDKFSIAEMHCIEAISKLESPNVTKLAEQLNITKGGITKIIKKLTLKSAILQYQKENNKKEIYYKLTPYGEKINEEHKKLHETICFSNIKFLSECDEQKLQIVEEFLKDYNKYLSDKIRSMK